MDMDNSDLEVARILSEYKERAYGNFNDGVYIKEQLYEFERQFFFEHSFSIVLPKVFIDMPEEIKKIKYISENRPKIIKMIPEGGIDIGFSLLGGALSKQKLLQTCSVVKNSMRKLNPATKILQEDTIEDRGKYLKWMDYISPVIDGKMYNVMFIANVGDNLYHGICNCHVSEQEAWKDVFYGIIHSIQPQERESCL